VNGRRISVRPPSRRIIGGAPPKPEVVDSLIQQTRIEAEHVLDDPWIAEHDPSMTWPVLLHDDFDTEFMALDESWQDELLAHARLLAELGPKLGSPPVVR
jgi:hypothetical protein